MVAGRAVPREATLQIHHLGAQAITFAVGALQLTFQLVDPHRGARPLLLRPFGTGLGLALSFNGRCLLSLHGEVLRIHALSLEIKTLDRS